MLHAETTTDRPTRELNGAEALMGFLTWLSTRAQPVTFSARHDPETAYDLFAQFTDANPCGTLGQDWLECLTSIPDEGTALTVTPMEMGTLERDEPYGCPFCRLVQGHPFSLPVQDGWLNWLCAAHICLREALDDIFTRWDLYAPR